MEQTIQFNSLEECPHLVFSMVIAIAQSWLQRGIRRQRLLLSMNQPLTASQLVKKTGIGFWTCRRLIGEMARMGMLMCMTEHRNKNRVFWLTLLGRECFRRLEIKNVGRKTTFFYPDVDYRKYSMVCFSHRGHLIRGFDGPCQPAHLRRKVVRLNPSLRMSANNARDAVKDMVKIGLVLRHGQRRGYPRYELTPEGASIQKLLLKAEEKPCFH